jgi:hypothetical protein
MMMADPINRPMIGMNTNASVAGALHPPSNVNNHFMPPRTMGMPMGGPMPPQQQPQHLGQPSTAQMQPNMPSHHVGGMEGGAGGGAMAMGMNMGQPGMGLSNPPVPNPMMSGYQQGGLGGMNPMPTGMHMNDPMRTANAMTTDSPRTAATGGGRGRRKAQGAPAAQRGPKRKKEMKGMPDSAPFPNPQSGYGQMMQPAQQGMSNQYSPFWQQQMQMQSHGLQPGMAGQPGMSGLGPPPDMRMGHTGAPMAPGGLMGQPMNLNPTAMDSKTKVQDFILNRRQRHEASQQ